jgi:hypothetical protein
MKKSILAVALFVTAVGVVASGEWKLVYERHNHPERGMSTCGYVHTSGYQVTQVQRWMLTPHCKSQPE